MTIFKPKTKKTIAYCNKKTTTLDAKHKEYINKFKLNDIDIQTLSEKKKRLIKTLNITNSKDVETMLELKDSIERIKKQIKCLKKNKKNYLLNNSNHIFSYFEEKKNINKGAAKKTLVDNFFKAGNSKSVPEKNDQSSVQKYLTNIDESYIDVNNFVIQTDICSHCHQGELIPVEQEGILVCNNCSINTKALIECDRPSYKDPPKEICFYAYKRINHFREILAQFQAKETTQIPADILENIKLQIKKERIDVKTMSNPMAKDILKKLGYNKYYEHIPFIKDKLGVKPPVMTQELEEILCNLFMDIQAPYAKYCPYDRVNFLNYYYTIYKLCELLEQTQFLPYFPMLKDRDKQIEQDQIWKHICNDLDWDFIQTI